MKTPITLTLRAKLIILALVFLWLTPLFSAPFALVSAITSFVLFACASAFAGGKS